MNIVARFASAILVVSAIVPAAFGSNNSEAEIKPLKPGMELSSGIAVSCERFADFLLERNYYVLNPTELRAPVSGASSIKTVGKRISVELAFYGGEGGHAVATGGENAIFEIVSVDSKECRLRVLDLY